MPFGTATETARNTPVYVQAQVQPTAPYSAGIPDSHVTTQQSSTAEEIIQRTAPQHMHGQKVTYVVPSDAQGQQQKQQNQQHVTQSRSEGVENKKQERL